MRLRRITTSFFIVSFLSLFFYSRFIEPDMLHINKIELADTAIKKNCIMVFMSDLHVPLSKKIERRLTASLNKIKPDIILIGGDFSSYRATAPFSIEKIKSFSRYGKVIMVRGNTDICGSRQCVYCSLKYPVDRLKSLPAVILLNEKMELPEFNIAVYGLDDPVTNHDDTLIFNSLHASQFNILLLHSVYKVSDEQKKRFNLICSGHTHGGQIFFLKPFLHLFDSAIDPRYISGRYFIGKTTLIVSNGIGMSFLPFRLGILPEMTAIRLERR